MDVIRVVCGVCGVHGEIAFGTAPKAAVPQCEEMEEGGEGAVVGSCACCGSVWVCLLPGDEFLIAMPAALHSSLEQVIRSQSQR